MLTKLARNVAVATLVAAPLFYPEAAHATGIMVARFGGEHGNPITLDPTALYYNPAMIAWSHGTHLYVEGLFAFRSLGYTRPSDAIDNPGSGTPSDAVPINSGKGSLSNFLVSPFLGVTSDLGVDGLGVGVAFYVPFGGSAKWDKVAGNPKYPGSVDGPQRWWDIEGTIRSAYFTVGGAYRLPGNLSLGVGANVVVHNTDDLRASGAVGTDDVVSGDTNVEGRAVLDTSGVTFSVGAGLTWAPTPDWTIGLSYQSQPGFGTMNEEGTLEKILPPGGITHQDVNVRYALPDVFRLGVAYRPTTSTELRLWGSYERWSLFKSQCIIDKAGVQDCILDDRGKPTTGSGTVVNNIPRYWQDAVAVRLSGSYWVKPSIELVAGLGYDGNAVPDKTQELSLPDEQKIEISAGAIFKDFLVDRMSLNLEYSAVIGLGRTVPLRTADPFDVPSRVPDSAGDYSEFIGVLTLGIGYAF